MVWDYIAYGHYATTFVVMTRRWGNRNGEGSSHFDWSTIEGRLILAWKKVHYFDRPVAAVVADIEYEAQNACTFIKVEYEPLPVVNSVHVALEGKQPLIHGEFKNYTQIKK